MKYKVGDEVLVRVTITEDYGPKTGGYAAYSKTDCHFQESDIYSLAPEFSYKEEIEVSDDNENWKVYPFLYLSPDPNFSYKYGVQVGTVVNFYKYARKIQPKEEVSWSMNIEENFASGVGHPIVPTYVEINGTKYKLQKVED